VRPNARENGQISPRPPFGLPDALVTVLTSRLSCRKAGNTRIFTPDKITATGYRKSVYRFGKDDVMMTPLACKLIWVAGIVSWFVIRYPFQLRAKRNRVIRSLFGRRETSILGFASICLYAIPAAYALTGFPKSLDRPFVPALVWLGLLALCAGLWLFLRSHAELGLNWSISLEVREQHALVQTGVYRFIRHPMYSSFFLMALAQILLLPNWFAGTAGLVGVGVLYAFRVHQEERVMRETFDGDYIRYMTKTKRLIPWIL
jgi:protein-S-isoprenylcysteine O-methyltransferase Ste14